MKVSIFKLVTAVCVLVASCCLAGGSVPATTTGQAATAQVVELRG